MKKCVVVALVFLLLCATSVAYADYVAYAVTKQGEEVPLPEHPEQIIAKNAKKLVQVRWGDYAGRKIRVGVLEADNQSGVGSYRYHSAHGDSYEGGFNEVPVNGIDALLTDALTKTGRFRVLTRTELGEVLDEQDLGASDRVAKPSAAKTGQVLGAEYLIQVVVNSYEANIGGKKGGLGGFSRKLRAVGGIKGGKNKSTVQMTFRLIDAETSEVVASDVVSGTISELNLDLGGVGWGGAGALGGFLGAYAKTPIGQAVLATVNVGVFGLVKQVGNLPTSGSVIKIDGDQVMVNLGAGVVNPGDRLMASSKGEEIIDPDTGLSLGSEDEQIGALEVTSVKEKFCYARPVGFEASRLTRGDRVVSTAAAATLEYGPAW